MVEASPSLRRKGFTATVSDDVALLSLCHRHTSHLALLHPTSPTHEAATGSDKPTTAAAAAAAAAVPIAVAAATTAAPVTVIPAATSAAPNALPCSSELLCDPQPVSPSNEARAERSGRTPSPYSAAPLSIPVMEGNKEVTGGQVHAAKLSLLVKAEEEREEGWHGTKGEDGFGAGSAHSTANDSMQMIASLPSSASAVEVGASFTLTAVSRMTEQFMGSQRNRMDRRDEQQAAQKERVQAAGSDFTTATATAIWSVPPKFDGTDKRLLQSLCARTGE